MLLTAMSLMLAAQDTDVIIAHADSIARPSAEAGPTENLAVRISSPEGELWRGTIRVSRNASASYQQSLSQPFRSACPPDSSYDRSESRSMNFSVYSPDSEKGPQYNINVSWSRPTIDADCRGSGTRTSQINHTLVLKPGERKVIDGDAGLKVEVSRP